MPMTTSDATTAVLQAIRANFQGFALEELRSRSWASATFLGARHQLTFRVEGKDAQAEADAFLADLDAAEFELPGHLMADIRLVSVARLAGEDTTRIRLEALTVEN